MDGEKSSQGNPEPRCPGPVPSWQHAQALRGQWMLRAAPGKKALSQAMEEQFQPGSLVGLGSPRRVAKAGAAEAAPALPRASPAPGSPAEAKASAAAPLGAAGLEEPAKPLAVQQEVKAVRSPVPSAGTQSPVPAPQRPRGCSPALPHSARCLSSEAVSRALLHLEQWTDVEMVEAATSERQQSLLSPLSTQLGALGEQQEGPAEWSVGAEQGSSEEDSDWDVSWDSSSDADMSQEEEEEEEEEEEVEEEEEEKEEEQQPQSSSLQGSSSLSPLAIAVAAEDAPDLPGASPAPQSPTEAEPAAAALTGAVLEEPPVPLAAQQDEKAVETAVPSKELSCHGTQSPPSVPYNTGDSGPALLCNDQSSPGQLLGQVLLQIRAQLQQLQEWIALEEAAGAAAAAPAQMEQTLVPGKSPVGEDLRQQEGAQEAELFQADVNSWEEVSNWEQHIGQALSQEETSLGQDMFPGSTHGSSARSSCELEELTQEAWEVESNSLVWMKPLALEEDDSWDELSVSKLSPEEDQQEKWRVFAAEALPVHIPRQAWVEEQAPQPCSPGLLCTFPALLHGQAPVGHAASPSGALHGQSCAPRKCPSRFRRLLRALRGLFRFRCLSAPPEE